MFLAINRNDGLFNKETSDQINVRINSIDNSHKLAQTGYSREHYYDDVVDVPMSFTMPMENNASLQYGKVIILNFTFVVNNSRRIIANLVGYEQPFELFCYACDKSGNKDLVSITKDGEIKFAVQPTITGTANIYIVIVKS